MRVGRILPIFNFTYQRGDRRNPSCHGKEKTKGRKSDGGGGGVNDMVTENGVNDAVEECGVDASVADE